MWFASMSTPEEYPWTVTLVNKLLQNDKKITGLFAENPFPDQPPKYVRAVLYRYSFAPMTIHKDCIGIVKNLASGFLQQETRKLPKEEFNVPMC